MKKTNQLGVAGILWRSIFTGIGYVLFVTLADALTRLAGLSVPTIAGMISNVGPYQDLLILFLSGVIIGLFIFASAMMVIFMIVETRHPEPIIPLSLFRNRIVAGSEVVIFLTAFALFGSIIFIPLFF